MRPLFATFAAVFVATACGGASASSRHSAAAKHDWPMFGYAPSRPNAGPAGGITAANVAKLRRQIVHLDGTVDSSPIYLHGVRIGAQIHDAFFVTTTYGKTEAIDAATGQRLWRFVPPGYSSWVRTPRITNASPVADPSRQSIYAASPDGVIQKLSVATGRVVWRVAITQLPSREKLTSSLNFSGGRVLATTGGYYGDAPPYQGHVAVIDAASGKLLQVWNSLCSDRQGLIAPSSCPTSDSGIWGRSGVVVDPASGALLVTTGNARFDGQANWGDSLLKLSADASQLLGNYTPANYQELESGDVDLGSTAPVVLGAGLYAQGGKDGKLRLLNAASLGPLGHTGGEVQVVATPGPTDLFTAPAVLHAGSTTRLFVADNQGFAAWQLAGGRLAKSWENGTGSTSPIVAGGLVFAYDPGGSGLHVYAAASGKQVAVLPAGRGHWNSPVIGDGRIALPEGNANDHSTRGVLDFYRLR
ncbi:MAG: outer membrane protein assembly factor BamB family protein [Gaiellaceae bacterium]